MLKNRLKFKKQTTFAKTISLSQNRPFMMLSRGLILLASLGTLVVMQAASAETFYKWVDKDGSTHYTQTPPGKNGVKSAQKVYIDDLAPPTPVALANTENGNSNGNPTSVMDSNQLANAANNGSVPNGSGRQIPQSMPQSQPMITPITPPPANRLIVPTQDQSRPVFSER
ncbi:MAG: DUF4124 domain-containing protein [Moraxellaceae bacterium]|nr:MAG: DUF4124 domain-containing protein [Moraxellaceae bacterium]